MVASINILYLRGLGLEPWPGNSLGLTEIHLGFPVCSNKLLNIVPYSKFIIIVSLVKYVERFSHSIGYEGFHLLGYNDE
jgi:hypothetical protein